MIRYRQFCYGRSNRLVRLPGAAVVSCNSCERRCASSSPSIGVAWLVIGIVTALNAILILLTVLGPWDQAGHLLRTITRRASRVESSLLATTSTRSEASMSATFASCPFSRTLVSLLST